MGLVRLFWSFLQVGLFTFGGGYASLPLVREQAVEINGWLTMPEFTELLTISQMTPGPVSINLATFVGLRTYGLPGAVLATAAFVLPSFILVSVLALLYRRYSEIRVVGNALAGLRPASVGLILAAGLSIVLMAFFGDGDIFVLFGSGSASVSVDYAAAALFAASFFLLRRFKLPQYAIILGCGAVGGAVYTIM
ncbi:MAG: chromate transporter [Clostridiales Family XIII bacterium]|jgi:chromate transporter|nr:chromate transporter [Clostridiales Family XIII bacterium]